jgi:major membrane immunogen (membrane-anchored lipoprotein)
MIMKFVPVYSLLILAICFYSCKQRKLNKYNDGIYEGMSRSKYIEEPYVGVSKIYIKNDSIIKVNFKIVDTSKGELFDQFYEKHFRGNQEYINQCRNDWKGVEYYPQKLLKQQNIDSIDAVSGATWSYNLFKNSTQIALKKALKH